MRAVFVLLLVLCALPIALAPAAEVYIDLQGDAAVTDVFYTFEKPFNQSFTHVIRGEVKNVVLSENVTFTQLGDASAINSTGETILNITTTAPVSRVKISYTQLHQIFENTESTRFVSELPFSGTFVRNVSVWIKLPTGYILVDSKYHPESGNVTSDGQRVTVYWDALYPEDITLVSVSYFAPTVGAERGVVRWLWVGLVVMILVVAWLIVHFRKRTHTELLRGFREDERKVIQYIREHRKVLQSEIQKEFSFSRAKTTRIVRRLTNRKLVEKTAAGRTNKISWKG